MKELSVN